MLLVRALPPPCAAAMALIDGNRCRRKSFSSTEIDADDDDKFAAVTESWQASIRRQAQLLLALAVSRKRNELLQRRKDGSVVQQVTAHEFAMLERAIALQSNKHANAQDGLKLALGQGTGDAAAGDG